MYCIVLYADAGRIEPHLKHRVEPLGSLSSSQHDEIQELLTSMKKKENDFHNEMSLDGDNIMGGEMDGIPGNPGAVTVLRDLRRHFRMLHRVLEEREQDLVCEIQNKRKVIVKKGLEQFSEDVKELSITADCLLTSHHLRSSQIMELFDNCKYRLQDNLAHFDERYALNTLDLTALHVCFDNNLKCLAAVHGEFSCFRMPAPERVQIHVQHTTRTLKITWKEPDIVKITEGSIFFKKYFNNDILSPIIFYEICISVDIGGESESVLKTIVCSADSSLCVEYQLEPPFLTQSHAVQVRAVCVVEEREIGGEWSLPICAPSPPQLRNNSPNCNSSQSVSNTRDNFASSPKKRKRSVSAPTSSGHSSTLQHVSFGHGNQEDMFIHPQSVLQQEMQSDSMRKFGDYRSISITVEHAGVASGTYKTVDEIVPGNSSERSRYWLRRFEKQKFPAPLWWLKKSLTSDTGKTNDIYFCLTYTKKDDVKYKPAVWSILIPPLMRDKDDENENCIEEDVMIYFTFARLKNNTDLYVSLEDMWLNHREGGNYRKADICGIIVKVDRHGLLGPGDAE